MRERREDRERDRDKERERERERVRRGGGDGGGGSSMLSVVRVHLPTGIPIAGCELSAYVLLRHADSTLSHEDVTEASTLDGYFLRCRW